VVPAHEGVTLRPAGAEDAAAIKALVHGARLNPFGLSWQRFTVAVDARGRIVGCVQLKRHRGGSRELASLVVARPWRGRGIGRALIRHTKRKAGLPLWLMCAGRLAPFYRRFGFRQVTQAGAMPHYFAAIYLLFRLFGRFARRERRLAVMVWRPAAG
jgi:amino-acid N-acetyltransferase